MLNKLMKYEIQSTARFFLPLYGALLVLALINKLFMMFSFNSESYGHGRSLINEALRRVADIPWLISLCVYLFIVAAVFVVTFIVIVQRFYKNLMGDEGYLMFTLPVSAAENILSKLLVSMMWVIASVVVTGLSIFLIVVSGDVLTAMPDLFVELLRGINSVFEMNAGVFLLLMAAGCFLGTAATILQVYVSVAIGQLVNRHRLLASVGTYIGINIAMQIVTSIFMVVLNLFDFYRITTIGPAMTVTWVFTLVFSVLLCAIFYLVTQYILSRKLNLE